MRVTGAVQHEVTYPVSFGPQKAWGSSWAWLPWQTLNHNKSLH